MYVVIDTPRSADSQGRDKHFMNLIISYLQQCLTEYMQRDCQPPEWGEPYPPKEETEKLSESEPVNNMI